LLPFFRYNILSLGGYASKCLQKREQRTDGTCSIIASSSIVVYKANTAVNIPAAKIAKAKGYSDHEAINHMAEA
jgi:hypothetical protein